MYYIGVIQKLRGPDFDHFWLPTYLNVDIFYPKRGQKEAFFYHLPTSSCPRSFWTTPYRISSNKTRRYYFFIGASTAGIIRTRVLIEGWYYYQDLMNIVLILKSTNPNIFIIKIACFLHGVIKNKYKLGKPIIS